CHGSVVLPCLLPLEVWVADVLRDDTRLRHDAPPIRRAGAAHQGCQRVIGLDARIALTPPAGAHAQVGERPPHNPPPGSGATTPTAPGTTPTCAPRRTWTIRRSAARR